MHKDFTLLREEELQEVGGIVRLWKHNKTRAEVMSINNSDENKTFGVAFRTPPKNSTGVAHILEHSVLCGSEKYPLKEPFVELLKSSLQTFLNALTFPDKTCYPVASTNLQDYYNLMDVYLDAVFFPRIDENVLAQEGWHIHAEDANKENWHFKGVVYNEMKGVYSSPDSVLAEQSQNAVFPDNTYSLDSGGNPADILNLSYAEFKEFHTNYYHPSNARFFFWGDDAEEARLEKLAEVLNGFDYLEPKSAIALQKPLSYERKIETSYAMEESDEEESNPKQSHVTVNWLLCEVKEAEQIMIFEMFEHILTALPGSPLRKALMDSGYGEDVTGCGLETDLRQAYYSIGLRSISSFDADKIEMLIMETLAQVSEEGFSEKEIQSALSATEFALRENNTGSYPRGLSAMFQSLSTWLYNEDPFSPLQWEAPLASIKARLAAGEKVFEDCIKKWFLDNMHRVCVVLIPDHSLADYRNAEERARLEAMIAPLSEKEEQELIELSHALTEAQEREDSPEALATIPVLSLTDIPLKGKENPLAIKEQSDLTILHHEIDTSGILYVRMLLPLENISQGDLSLLSLYCRSLTEMGTQKRNFVELGLEIAATCGGLGAGVSVHNRVDQDEALLYMQISAKAVEEKIPALCALMEEILLLPNFDNAERFMQMAWEDKARFEQSMIPAGHSLLASFLSGMHSRSGALSESIGGIPYWGAIRKICEELGAETGQGFEAIRTRLQNIHAQVMCFNAPVLSFTGTEKLLAKTQCFVDFVRTLPEAKKDAQAFDFNFDWTPQAFVVPAQVNYVGLGGNIKAAGYEYHGSSHVISRFLRMGYLWDRVRVQGGAYGVFARYSRNTGAMLFLSYRDPNVERTLDVYRKSAEYLGNLTLSQAELTKAIIGAIGDIDSYLLPSAKGNAALWEYMTGYTKEMKMQTREEVLGTKLEDFHNFAPYLQKTIINAIPSALGGQAVASYGESQDWKITKLL